MSKTAGVVTTIKARCKRCHSCVSGCPAGAIRLEDGRAVVVARRCIGCGHCVRLCAQRAKRVESAIRPLRRLLASGRFVWAALDPSFPAAFPDARPGQVVTGLRRLGFARVAEVAYGADLVGREYARLAREPGRRLVITTHCPAAVQYVEKYVPALVAHLAPVVSPAIALGRVLKAADPTAAVVYVGPCVAKKAEVRDPRVAGAVDLALTYAELTRLLTLARIELAELPESEPEGPRPGAGLIFPTPGGPLRTAGIRADPLEGDVLAVEGREQCLALLPELAAGRLRARLVDVRFCRGCVDGPGFASTQSQAARQELVAAYARERLAARGPASASPGPANHGAPDLRRDFQPLEVRLPVPSDGEISRILGRIGRADRSAQLDCRACGYATCREKAIAVYQGRAEVEECLPYLVEQRHESLRCEDARAQLIAGIVHDLRAPLTAIRVQLELASAGSGHLSPSSRESLAASAERIDSLLGLVDDLLELSRVEAGQVARDVGPLDLAALLHGVACLQSAEAQSRGISVEERLSPDLPTVEADREDLVRLFTNLLSNAVKYNRPGGRVWIAAAAEPRAVRVEVGDTGIGIAPEHLPHLFDEFYRVRTRETQDVVGSGLGLAVVKRIADAYRATVAVTSQPGEGSIFVVTLPL